MRERGEMFHLYSSLSLSGSDEEKLEKSRKIIFISNQWIKESKLKKKRWEIQFFHNNKLGSGLCREKHLCGIQKQQRNTRFYTKSPSKSAPNETAEKIVRFYLIEESRVMWKSRFFDFSTIKLCVSVSLHNELESWRRSFDVYHLYDGRPQLVFCHIEFLFFFISCLRTQQTKRKKKSSSPKEKQRRGKKST